MFVNNTQILQVQFCEQANTIIDINPNLQQSIIAYMH